MLGGAVGRSTPGVRRAPRLPLPPPRLVVCSHAALLRGPPPRCVSCAPPLVVSRLSSSVYRLRARSSAAAACCCSLRRGSWAFNVRGVCLHAALLRVPRPRCASRAWPPRRFVRPAFAAGCGQRARCALCVLCAKPVFFKQPHFKYWAGCIRRGVLAKPSPPKTTHAFPGGGVKAV